MNSIERKRRIPLSVPCLRGRELELITEAVKSEWVSTAGPFVTSFEKNICQYTGAVHATACQSGTAGLHTALLLAGVLPDDEVIVPTITFIAPINTVHYVRAHPVFIDCDDFLCMDVNKVAQFLRQECHKDSSGQTRNKRTGRRISAVIPVHIFGNVVDMPPLLQLARDWNIKVIEDATESLGTYWTSGPLAGKFAGTVGDFGVYSFNGNKIITTGGGGVLITPSGDLAQKAKYLQTQAKDDEVRYIHNEIGFNYRMTNLQAAMGIAQLEQIESFISRKRNIFNEYRSAFERSQKASIMPFRDDIRANYWFISLLLHQGDSDARDQMMALAEERGIQTRPLWFPSHQQLPYRECQSYLTINAAKYWASIINLPCSSGLEAKDSEYVASAILECLECL